jgi:hypothetical protein
VDRSVERAAAVRAAAVPVEAVVQVVAEEQAVAAVQVVAEEPAGAVLQVVAEARAGAVLPLDLCPV